MPGPLLKDTLKQLEALGSEKLQAQNTRHGVTGKQFGVKLGDLRKVAETLKRNRELALELWDTDLHEARLLAVLLLKPADLSATELDRMVRSGSSPQIADWLNSYIVKEHPEKEKLRQKWMSAKDPWAARAGWALTSGRVARSPEGIDIPGLLDRIEKEMPKADPAEQWTMNSCLANIGIHHPKLRKRALDIGEKHGIYRDYPVSKGCTSPFAPVWINEMVKRQG
jgi:3-methyladenine DNA glycosylase AlkD